MTYATSALLTIEFRETDTLWHVGVTHIFFNHWHGIMNWFFQHNDIDMKQQIAVIILLFSSQIAQYCSTLKLWDIRRAFPRMQVRIILRLVVSRHILFRVNVENMSKQRCTFWKWRPLHLLVLVDAACSRYFVWFWSTVSLRTWRHSFIMWT